MLDYTGAGGGQIPFYCAVLEEPLVSCVLALTVLPEGTEIDCIIFLPCKTTVFLFPYSALRKESLLPSLT